MLSLIQHLGTEDYPRLRLGIGRPPGQLPAEAFVLQKFKPEEWAAMTVIYARGVEAVKVILSEGLEAAMSRFNTRG
jgi:PTH1 family peptidyl-tRNA hydrolase